MVSRFVAEARAVNQIRHRNIIDIFSFGQLADGRQYYVMEYLDGEPLDALIDRERGTLSLAEALPILRGDRDARSTPRTPRASPTAISSPRTSSSARDADGGAVPEAARLRHREAARRAEDGAQAQDAHRRADRHAVLHVARAVPRHGRRSPHRHLRVRRASTYQMLTGTYPFDGDDYMSILMKQIDRRAAAAVAR